MILLMGLLEVQLYSNMYSILELILSFLLELFSLQALLHVPLQFFFVYSNFPISAAFISCFYPFMGVMIFKVSLYLL